MSNSDVKVFLKYKDKDVRYPEIRTAFLLELEPLVIGRKIKYFNYANKATTYQITELEDVFDSPDCTDNQSTNSVPGRYVVTRLHYFTSKKKIEKFRTVRLLISEKGLANTC